MQKSRNGIPHDLLELWSSDKDGSYSERTKYGMFGVIIHEVGHNFFPMIVNSDERQWTWMDEGINTFVQYVAEQDFGQSYPKP